MPDRWHQKAIRVRQGRPAEKVTRVTRDLKVKLDRLVQRALQGSAS